MVKYWSILFFLVFSCLISCTPSTLEELRREGKIEMEKLTADLKLIKHRKDIQKASKHLAKRFNRIADLLIKTKRFSEIDTNPPLIGDELFAELARIYELPGGRESIEATQREAIHHLDRALSKN